MQQLATEVAILHVKIMIAGGIMDKLRESESILREYYMNYDALTSTGSCPICGKRPLESRDKIKDRLMEASKVLDASRGTVVKIEMEFRLKEKALQEMMDQLSPA